MIVFLLAIIIIYLVLSAQFDNFLDPLVILVTVPLALFGALLTLWYFDQTLNIFSEIVMIMLIGLNTEQLILSKLGLKTLKSEQYPKLNLTGSYGYYENDTEAAFLKYNRYFSPQFGLNIGMKIFDGLKLNRSIQNAKIEVENRELYIKEIEERISALMTATYLDYKNHLKTIILGQKSMSLAKKNLDIAMKAFQSGLISSIQLREAQEDLYDASSEFVNAYYNAKVKETELLSISGILIK